MLVLAQELLLLCLMGRQSGRAKGAKGWANFFATMSLLLMMLESALREKHNGSGFPSCVGEAGCGDHPHCLMGERFFEPGGPADQAASRTKAEGVMQFLDCLAGDCCNDGKSPGWIRCGSDQNLL